MPREIDIRRSAGRLEIPTGFAVGYRRRAVARTLEPIVLQASGGCAITLLCGDNGAGKTTLLRTLAGMIPRVAGEPPQWNGSALAAAIRAGCVCYLPEELSLPGDLTGGQLLAALCENRTQARQRAGLLGLALATPFDRLSKGSRQKLRLIAALEAMERAQLALLDEPFSGLDIPARAWAMEELRMLFEGTGRRLIVSLHTEQLPAGWSDSSLEVGAGTIRAGPAFTSMYQARAYYQPPVPATSAR